MCVYIYKCEGKCLGVYRKMFMWKGEWMCMKESVKIYTGRCLYKKENVCVWRKMLRNNVKIYTGRCWYKKENVYIYIYEGKHLDRYRKMFLYKGTCIYI